MAQQDITIQLDPGQGMNIKRPGDFCYLKFGESPLAVLIDGTRTVMLKGDKRRQPGGRPFEEMYVENVGDFPSSYVLVIGDGDYFRQIIQGEVAVRPSIRGADGQLKPDTRRDIGAYVDVDPDEQSFSKGTTNDKSSFWGGSGAVSVAVTPDLFIGSIIGAAPELRARETGALIANVGAESEGVAVDSRRNRMVNGVSTSGAQRLDLYELTAPYKFIDDYAHGERFYDIAYNPDRDEILIKNDAFWNTGAIVAIRAGDLTEDRRSEAGNEPADRGGLAYLDGKLYSFATGTNAIEIFDAETLEKLGSDSISNVRNYGAGGDPESNRIWYVNSSTDLLFAYLEATTIPARGAAILDGCSSPGILDPDRVNTFAEITVSRADDGAIQATGELIRAALDFYLGYGKFAPDDYLDHVYAIRLPDGRSVSSGYESFKAANVEDNFTAELPGRIVLTVDDNL